MDDLGGGSGNVIGPEAHEGGHGVAIEVFVEVGGVIINPEARP